MRVLSILHLSDVNYSYYMIEGFRIRDSPAIFGILVEVYINTEFMQQLVLVKANDGISV